MRVRMYVFSRFFYEANRGPRLAAVSTDRSRRNQSSPCVQSILARGGGAPGAQGSNTPWRAKTVFGRRAGVAVGVAVLTVVPEPKRRAFAAGQTRPSGAKSIAIGLSRPAIAVESWKPPGSVTAPPPRIRPSP